MSEMIDFDENNYAHDLHQIDHRFEIKNQHRIRLSRVGALGMSPEHTTEEDSWFAIGSHGSRAQGQVVRTILDNWAQVENDFKHLGRGLWRYYMLVSMVVNSMRSMALISNLFYLSQAAERTTRPLESPVKKMSEFIQFSDISPIADKKFKSVEDPRLQLSFLTQILNSNLSNIKQVRQLISQPTPSSLALITTLNHHNYADLLWDSVVVKIFRRKEVRGGDGEEIEQLSSIESADKEEELEDRAVL